MILLTASLQGCSDEQAVEQAREEAMKEGEARSVGAEQVG